VSTYSYTARSDDGREVRGTIDASDEAAAARELRVKNLTVLRVSSRAGAWFGPRRPRLDPCAKAAMARRLAAMIGAGMPAGEALEAIRDGSGDAALRGVLAEVSTRVHLGAYPSEALRDHADVFDRVFVAVVKTTEPVGPLDEALLRVAAHFDAVERLTASVRAAWRPAALSLLVLAVATTALLGWIVPAFETVAGHGRAGTLPPLTRALFDLSRFARNAAPALGVATAAAAVAAALAAGPLRARWHRALLALPVAGRLAMLAAQARLARALATLAGAGVPALAALEIVGEASGNRAVEDAMAPVRDAVRRGAGMGDALARSRMFPPALSRAAGAAEKGGGLAAATESLAKAQEEEAIVVLERFGRRAELLVTALALAAAAASVAAMAIPLAR
jgi:type IV pilus assembly protein PilC